jgi:hypothetical protein
MITSIQLPDALTYVGNIPELIIETTAPTVGFKISKGAELILTETYTVDEDGFARVVIRDFIDEQLQMNLPVGALFAQVDSVAVFTIEVTTGVDVDSFSFKAVKGGTNRVSFDSAAFFASSWLTWQPQIKAVKYAQREHLSYYAQEQSVVKVKAYFSGGASEVITLHTLTAGGHYTMDVSFSLIRTLFTAQPIYFDVYVEGGTPTADKTWRQRYRLDAEPFEFEDFFLFENSLGGYDTIRLTGDRQATNPVEVDAALFYDEYQRDYQVTPRLAFEKNTGYFRSKQEMLWTEDFFQSIHRWYLLDGSLVEINLINPEFISLENQLMSLDFKFSYQKQSKYLSIREDVDTLYNPVIIGPDDDQYYLPPNLQTFPQVLAPTSTLMFPVQIPGQSSWAFMTWGTMVSYLGGSVPHNSLQGLNQGNYQHLTASELATVQGITRSLDAMGALIRYNFPSKVSGSAGEAPSDFVTVAQVAAALTNADNWDTAYGWGYHGDAGYATTSQLHNALTLGTNQNGLSLSGQTLSLGLASGSATGALSSANWTAFNNKIGGSGTTNYLAKFTAGGTVGNSQVFDNGTNVLIDTLNNNGAKLQVNGTGTFISPNNVIGSLLIQGGKNVVTTLGEINSKLDFGSNDTSVTEIDGFRVAGRIASVTEISNGAQVGMAFYTYNQDASPKLKEAIRINSFGNVGIGTESPQAKLHISNSLGGAIPSNYLIIEGSIANNSNIPGISLKGGTLATTYPSISIANGGLALALNSGIASAYNNPAQLLLNNGVITLSTANNASLSERMRITSDGKLLLNTTVNAGFQLDVNGTARATAFFTSSDKRKKDIISQDGDLAIYRFKGDSQIHYGYIAQDMRALYPHQVSKGTDGMLSLNYVEILVKKVHDLESKLKRHGLD